MGRSLGATASSASQHPCALGQDYARCLAPKMQERRGFRSSTLHNLENCIKTETYCLAITFDSARCQSVVNAGVRITIVFLMARSEGSLGSKIDQKTHPRNQ